MERVKRFILRHFEVILVSVILAAVASMNYLMYQKMAFLNFYYLPVVAAGYIMGRKVSVYVSMLCISFVSFNAIITPDRFTTEASFTLSSFFNILTWGAFLVLVAITVGILYDEKEKRLKELRVAYTGIIEILTKYIESKDEFTKGHSARVAEHAARVAAALGLTESEIENIRIAGLLHDIGKIDISTDLINKASALTTEEKKIMDTHVVQGVEKITLLRSVFSEVIPIIMSHHKYYTDGGKEANINIPLGSRIIAVADAFDAIVTDRPYRAGKPYWQAINEIEKGSGTQFDPEVVRIFRQITSTETEVLAASTK